MLCKVLVLDLPYHLDRPFDYLCEDSVRRGNIVKVPFGRANRLRHGVVTEVLESSEPQPDGLKPVHSVVCDRFSLSEEMLGLCFFLKDYTLCSFTEALRAIMPPGFLAEELNIKVGKTVALALSEAEAEELLSRSGRGALRSEGQRELLRYLIEVGVADRALCLSLAGVTPAHITALASRGVLSVSEYEMIRNPYAEYARERDATEITLSEAQKTAYDSIERVYEREGPGAALLFGVTGSGKTKVIMRAIDRTLADGKGAIMLVPEIALTPQTVNLFCRRYGERVAVIHSSLSQGERMDAWRRIRRGEVDLVIGTRSAIFAPMSNIGLIVIDEEHEHTYKSESNPKYHARDVAAYRCAHHSALMLLASATPSLESFYKAQSGKYTLVPLRERYGGVKLPRAVIVDMREELRLGNTTPISKRLLTSLAEAGECGEQAILFLNRRGYSSQISCKECGEVITCPHCSVSLTYHTDAEGGRLLCHLCGYSVRTPRACPACSAEHLSFLGFGTQKAEGELERLLPDMPLLRMDADTAVGKMAYDRMLEDFRLGRYDILLGTQMVAKGHDFPRVTLVGVLLADTSLYMGDFRAAERTFSLLTQVIGRAGRASDNGIAVIQTYSPKNETIRLACLQDYESFYEGEIALRRELSYPPFCDMVQLTLSAEDERELFEASRRLSEALLSRLNGEYGSQPFTVFGPFEAQVYKQSEKYRMRMVVKCRLNKLSRALFGELLNEFAACRGVALSVDLNPLTV